MNDHGGHELPDGWWTVSPANDQWSQASLPGLSWLIQETRHAGQFARTVAIVFDEDDARHICEMHNSRLQEEM